MLTTEETATETMLDQLATLLTCFDKVSKIGFTTVRKRLVVTQDPSSGEEGCRSSIYCFETLEHYGEDSLQPKVSALVNLTRLCARLPSLASGFGRFVRRLDLEFSLAEQAIPSQTELADMLRVFHDVTWLTLREDTTDIGEDSGISTGESFCAVPAESLSRQPLCRLQTFIIHDEDQSRGEINAVDVLKIIKAHRTTLRYLAATGQIFHDDAPDLEITQLHFLLFMPKLEKVRLAFGLKLGYGNVLSRSRLLHDQTNIPIDERWLKYLSWQDKVQMLLPYYYAICDVRDENYWPAVGILHKLIHSFEKAADQFSRDAGGVTRLRIQDRSHELT